MKHINPLLSQNIHLLGDLLGRTLKEQVGVKFYNNVERIRKLSKESHVTEDPSIALKLKKLIRKQTNEDLLLLARAFSHFLNLANIAESYQSVLETTQSQTSESKLALDKTFHSLLQQKKIPKKKILATVNSLKMDLVLTAHPTEVKRRTLIRLLASIVDVLKIKDRVKITKHEYDQLVEKLHALITSIWQTDEIRRKRPTPVEEAKWGLAIIEDSLWDAVPKYCRTVNELLQRYCGDELALDISPFKFGSWMGGDRDGNPNVTAKITYKVCLLSRWMAADLYERELRHLIHHLSMQACNNQLRHVVGKEKEPYRVILRKLREKLQQTKQMIEKALASPSHRLRSQDKLIEFNELIDPLLLCYRSLCECNAKVIADQELLDLIRRAYCFGLTLTQLDIRQEAKCHSELMSEITQALGLGCYIKWDEKARMEFLQKELKNKRPLIPKALALSAQNQEVLDTFVLLAGELRDSFGAYVISMTSSASDILLVLLLQQEVGVKEPLRIVPLFETLNDLNHAAEVMQALFAAPGYIEIFNNNQEVMIGYSDSSKDAGKLAAAWAQYKAQEALLTIAKKANVKLTFFHGRGGSVGRGGGPIHLALSSMPPNSVCGRMRVTEQGEVIAQKFGFMELSLTNLSLYTAAVMNATLDPPPSPKPEWRALMETMAEVSYATYCRVLRDEPKFIEYFQKITPQHALNNLSIGSRPSRRKGVGGIEQLRAIPWVFAWTQIRLNLPAWLGVGEALHFAITHHQKKILQEMLHKWPFFDAFMDMLDMVLAKSDVTLVKFYEACLGDDSLAPIGKKLRSALLSTVKINQALVGKSMLSKVRQQYRASINVRKTYADPINLIQAEIMHRLSLPVNSKAKKMLEDALMVTIAGIAAAMKNTG